ncbi:MAG: porin family protein [Candidatus Cyclobacteriaceae bacterium M2_1C_046]
MVKRIIPLFAFLLISFCTFSQATIGFSFSTNLSTNRVEYERDTIDFSTNNSGVRFSAGPIVDWQLTENYYVSTGILFVSKRVGLTAISDDVPAVREEEVYNLQYVAIPATLKLYTNEVSMDTKIYFQFGGSFEFNVKQEPKEENFTYINEFRVFDTSLLFGLGAEYRAGVNTLLFAGFSYSRGLIDSVDETIPLQNNLIIKNDLLSLNLGVKF